MIYHFRELPGDVFSRAGGKGSSLARLYQAGYPVPEGVVILPEAFGDGEGLAPATWTTLQTKLARLRSENGQTAFAVRSSAVAEDSAHASFAGEFETMLDVRGDGEIAAAIEAVRRSRQSERAAAYSQAQGLAAEQEMAVVVQKMVRAEYAGVLFTADPLTGSYTAMVGNFVSGLGDRLVSGEATGEAFRLQRPNGRYEGPAALKRYAKQLYKLAARLEEELGGPQDIEWAAAGGKVYVLQARPVTTLQTYNPATGEWNDSLGGDYLWTNTNYGEAVPDVMTPLTWSLVQMLEEATLSLPIPGNHPLMGNIGGRFYMNMSLLASMFRALGMSDRRLAEESEEFYGNLPAGLTIPLIPFARWRLVRQLLPPGFRLWREVRARRKALPDFIAQTPDRCAALGQRIRAAGTAADLLALWLSDVEPAVRDGFRMLQAATSQYENLIRPLRRSLTEMVGTADANSLMSGLSGSGDMLASLGPVVGLWQVAQGQLSREAYLQQYGHRGAHEIEVSWPRPAEEPDWIERQLAALADTDVEALLAQRQAEQAAAWARVAERYGSGKAKRLEKSLAKAAEAARGREGTRSELVRLLGVVRLFALRAGEVTGLGDDIFFLSADEIGQVLAGERGIVEAIAARKETHARYSALPPYPAIINGRFDPFQWAADPNRRSDLFDSHQTAAPIVSNGSTIQGFAGAVGVVEGIVRRLDSAEEGHLLRPGEILVTATTNIGWTPLFPRAAAIVTDVGAPLSHAAIVARELGIPAVVGCGVATMRLNTGDRVRVNGGQGVVEILEV